MGHGGARPGSGPKKKKIVLPVEAVPSVISGVPPSPTPSLPLASPPSVTNTQIDEEQILQKLSELALAGNPIALRLFLEQRERSAKIDLMQAQARNIKLKNRVLTNILNKKGIELGEDEYEPEEDPVVARQRLKAVGQ